MPAQYQNGMSLGFHSFILFFEICRECAIAVKPHQVDCVEIELYFLKAYRVLPVPVLLPLLWSIYLQDICLQNMKFPAVQKTGLQFFNNRAQLFVDLFTRRIAQGGQEPILPWTNREKDAGVCNMSLDWPQTVTIQSQVHAQKTAP